jgi:adenine-specific DNA-methyltransferase
VVVDDWFKGADPWPCVSPERLELLKHLEASFPVLEDVATATRVSIGVATGADKVFITDDPNLVEHERLLPLAVAKDTMTGRLEWSRHYLVNPWEPDGSLVDLDLYPQLKHYFEDNEDTIRKRNVGKKNPERWCRTIDKVHYGLTGRRKLLIPDIKNVAHPVLDEGTVYPHHNLYHVTSDEWDLRVLGGILLSQVGQFFIECYAVRMQGGFLRFQAQYLRRIRVPRPGDIEPDQAQALAEAFNNRDLEAATQAAVDVYGIDRIPD